MELWNVKHRSGAVGDFFEQSGLLGVIVNICNGLKREIRNYQTETELRRTTGPFNATTSRPRRMQRRA